MVFKICRASDDCEFKDNNKPCENAYVKMTERIKTFRRCDCFTGDVIIHERSYIDKYWCVDINNLEELMTLQKEVADPLIIENDRLEEADALITIFDDYLE